MHMTIYDLNQCLVRVRTYLGAKPDQKPTCCRLQHAMISFSWNTSAVSHLAFRGNTCGGTSALSFRLWHERKAAKDMFFWLESLSHVNNLKQVEAV